MIKFVKIKKSDIQGKRYTAIFYNEKREQEKTTHFGHDKGSTFIDHKNTQTKNAWVDRHKVRGTFDIPTSASALAYYLLWTETTLNGGLQNYLRRFKLSKY